MFYFGTLKSFLRADHKIEDLNRIGRNPKKKWTRWSEPHRTAGAHRHPGGDRHPQGHGHRPSRCPAYRGGQRLPRTPRKVRPRPLNRRALPIDLPGDRSWIVGFEGPLVQSVKPGSWLTRTGGAHAMAGAGTGGLEAMWPRGRRRSDRHAKIQPPRRSLVSGGDCGWLGLCRTSLTSFLRSPEVRFALGPIRIRERFSPLCPPHACRLHRRLPRLTAWNSPTSCKASGRLSGHLGCDRRHVMRHRSGNDLNGFADRRGGAPDCVITPFSHNFYQSPGFAVIGASSASVWEGGGDLSVPGSTGSDS